MTLLYFITEGDVEMNEQFLKQVEEQFLIRKIKKATVISAGNVNSTYRIESNGANYILQKINKFVFKRPEEVMQNIRSVSRFLENKVLKEGGNPKREVLHPIDTLDGNRFFIDNDGEYWRMYHLIDGAVTYDTINSEEMFYKVGKAFGQFQNRLINYNTSSLYEAIPGFHNTPKRFMDFKLAIIADKVGRLAEIQGQPNHILQKAIDYIMSKEDELRLIEIGKLYGELPIRVTHNDTKINNVMIDENTGEPICIIDLDTIGPDSVLVDFGDAIRSGANRVGEEPQRLDDAKLDIDLFSAYTKGYLEQTVTVDKNGKVNQDPQKGIIESEIQLLHKAPKILTIELVMRFLEDYLNGDEYFKIKPNQPADINLRRGITQMYLAKDMEIKESEMKKIIETIVAEKIETKKSK